MSVPIKNLQQENVAKFTEFPIVLTSCTVDSMPSTVTKSNIHVKSFKVYIKCLKDHHISSLNKVFHTVRKYSPTLTILQQNTKETLFYVLLWNFWNYFLV